MNTGAYLIAALVSISSLLLNAQPYIAPDFYGEAPKKTIGFWPNNGQVIDVAGNPRPDISYYSEGGFPRLYMRKGTQMSFVMSKVDTTTSLDTLWRIDMRLRGERVQNVDPIVYDVRDQIHNFYMPWCGNGVENVHGYSRTIYENVYSNIDMHFYSGGLGQKMCFVVLPGGDPADLLLEFQGQDSLGIDFTGALKMYLQQQWIRLEEAVAYQVGPGNVIIPLGWNADYQNTSGTALVSFNFSSYDPSLPLVFQIGPPPAMGGGGNTSGVCWGTYFGGDEEDQVNDSDVDPDGNYYVTGHTYSTYAQFPVTLGQSYFQGYPSIFISRFDAEHALIWTNYIGGSGGPQSGRGIAVRKGKFTTDVYIGGNTTSSDFSCWDDLTAYYDATATTSNNGFLARFNHISGIRQWSTYFGNLNTTVTNITIDASGRLVAVGGTQGDLPQHQVPLPPNAEQWPFSGPFYDDGWVALFTTDDQVLWSTFIGGDGSDFASCVKAKAGKLVVSGRTTAGLNQMLDGGPNAYDQSFAGGLGDAWIVEFTPDGDQTWGTCIGGSSTENAGYQGLDIDGLNGDIYLGGVTQSANFPMVPGANWHDNTLSGSGGFLVRFSGADRSPLWMTFIDGHVHSVLVVKDYPIYIGGATTNPALSTQPANGVYYEDNRRGAEDGFIMCFKKDQTRIWSTYFGGDDTAPYTDYIWTLALDGAEYLYAAGFTGVNADFGQWWPFSNPGSPAWFDDDYGQPTCDGFTAAFCVQDLFTGISERADYVASAWYDPVLNALLVNGLTAGRSHGTLYDVAGRVVRVFDIRSDGHSPQNLALPNMAPGAYVFTVPGNLHKVFVVER